MGDRRARARARLHAARCRVGLARARARVPRRSRARGRRYRAVSDGARRERRLQNVRFAVPAGDADASSAPTGSRSTARSSRWSATRTAYRLQGAPQTTREQASVRLPPDIEVLVRNSRVLYLDAARSVAWDFQNVAGSLRRDDDVLTLEASALPPAEFAEHIELTAQAFVVADADGRRASSRAIGACRPTSTPWISRSQRGCFRRRRSRRKPAAATWPCGSSGRRACSWAARRTSRSPTWRCRARSAQSIRASSASRYRAIGSARAIPGGSRCATSPSRAPAAPGPKRPPSTSTSGAMPTASSISLCAAASCASTI